MLYLCICVFVFFVFVRLTLGNIIFYILEQSSFQKYAFLYFVICCISGTLSYASNPPKILAWRLSIALESPLSSPFWHCQDYCITLLRKCRSNLVQIKKNLKDHLSLSAQPLLIVIIWWQRSWISKITFVSTLSMFFIFVITVMMTILILFIP